MKRVASRSGVLGEAARRRDDPVRAGAGAAAATAKVLGAGRAGQTQARQQGRPADKQPGSRAVSQAKQAGRQADRQPGMEPGRQAGRQEGRLSSLEQTRLPPRKGRKTRSSCGGFRARWSAPLLPLSVPFFLRHSPRPRVSVLFSSFVPAGYISSFLSYS